METNQKNQLQCQSAFGLILEFSLHNHSPFVMKISLPNINIHMFTIPCDIKLAVCTYIVAIQQLYNRYTFSDKVGPMWIL